MDANTPRRENDLSDVERRLAAWQPTAESAGADAVLFAAGLAAGRRGRVRLLWPLLCGLLAVGCGAWALTERVERQALASRLQDSSATPGAVPGAVPDPSYTPSADDYLHLRQRMEQDASRWPAASSANPPAPEPPQPPIFSVGQRNRFLDP